VPHIRAKSKNVGRCKHGKMPKKGKGGRGFFIEQGEYNDDVQGAVPYSGRPEEGGDGEDRSGRAVK